MQPQSKTEQRAQVLLDGKAIEISPAKRKLPEGAEKQDLACRFDVGARAASQENINDYIDRACLGFDLV